MYIAAHGWTYGCLLCSLFCHFLYPEKLLLMLLSATYTGHISNFAVSRYSHLNLFCFRNMQVKSKVVSNSYQSSIYIGDSAFKIIVFMCSAVVLLSVYIIFTKPRLISPRASVKLPKMSEYPTDFRITL